MDPEEVLKITGEIYDLCNLILDTTASGKTSRDKGIRFLAGQIQEKNTRLHDMAGVDTLLRRPDA